MNDIPVSSKSFYSYHCDIASCPSVCVCVCVQVGRSVDETLRLVQAFQYTDHKGEGEPNGVITLASLLPHLFVQCVQLVGSPGR